MTGTPGPRVSLIAAVSTNGVIGHQGRLPWHLPEDLRRFKALTLGHTIVMGRKTWQSIGRLLPGRRNVIVSRDPNLHVEGADVVPSVAAAIAIAHEDAEVFVIGGGEIYTATIHAAHRLHLTEVAVDVQGDAFFPRFDREQWTQTSRSTHVSSTGVAFDFVVYDRPN